MSGQIGERTARTGPHPVEDDATPRPHPSLDPTDATATADAPGTAGVPADEQPTAAVPAVPAQARPTERIPPVRETAGTTAGSTSTSADDGEASPPASGDAPGEGADAPTGAPGTSSSDGSDQETDPAPAQDTESAAPRRPSTAGSRRTKKGKPVMPSWDEVLLGVRGQR